MARPVILLRFHQYRGGNGIYADAAAGGIQGLCSGLLPVDADIPAACGKGDGLLGRGSVEYQEEISNLQRHHIGGGSADSCRAGVYIGRIC